jgi:hypothetical protein
MFIRLTYLLQSTLCIYAFLVIKHILRAFVVNHPHLLQHCENHYHFQNSDLCVVYFLLTQESEKGHSGPDLMARVDYFSPKTFQFFSTKSMMVWWHIIIVQ